jgi:protein phosphatase
VAFVPSVPTLPQPTAPLDLPDPCLVVLVGAAGSGKSTLAARLFHADQILSSDAYRAAVSGDEGDQRSTRRAFSILHQELERRLRASLTVVVDATNVTSLARRSLLLRARATGVPAVAIVLDLEPDLVLGRNQARTGRVVPSAAVERQLAALARSLRLDQLAAEGFAAIHILRSAQEVELLTLTRARIERPA